MPSDPPYRDPDWLHSQYHDHERTQREIADECGVSPRTIRTYMKRFGIETRAVRGENHGHYGTTRDESTRRKISEALTGRHVSDETKQLMSEAHEGSEVAPDVRDRIAESLRGTTRDEETRRRMSESTAGEQNPNWRGGYSKRYGAGWQFARERVKERDGVCQHCGHDGSEHRLEVHHVVPVRLFRKATDVDISDAHVLENLVLLCKQCHGRAEHGKISFPVPESSIPAQIGEIYK